MSACCCRTPRSSRRCWSPRPLTGIVPVGLNPVRRGAALARDVTHADCQVVLADSASRDQSSATSTTSTSTRPSGPPRWRVTRDAPVSRTTPTPADLFMLIYTSGTSGDPKAVICSQGKVAIAGVMMTQRFDLGPDDVCYVSMPLFHSNAVLVGWAVALACRRLTCVAAQVLRVAVPSRRPPLRRDVRQLCRQAAVVRARHARAARRRRQPAAGGLRQRGRTAPTSSDSRGGSTPLVMDGFGSTEGGIAIGRTPDTPPGSLGPLPDGTEIVDVETGEPCPPGVTGELVNVSDAGPFRGLLQRSRGRRRADARRRVPQRRPRLPRRERLRLLRGPAR